MLPARRCAKLFRALIHSVISATLSGAAAEEGPMSLPMTDKGMRIREVKHLPEVLSLHVSGSWTKPGTVWFQSPRATSL